MPGKWNNLFSNIFGESLFVKVVENIIGVIFKAELKE